MWVRDEAATQLFVPPEQWASDYMELYDSSDDFDEMDRINVAYHSNRSTEAKDLYSRLKTALALPTPDVALCKGFCESKHHKILWDEKCHWKNCRHCSQCAAHRNS